MTRFWFAFLLALAPLCARGASWEAPDWNSHSPSLLAEPLADDSMRVTVHRLGNGLTVYLSPNDQEPRLTVRIGVRAGAAHDPGDSTGMAHYLEHMLFKGTRRLGTLDYEKERAHLERIAKLYEELFALTDPGRRKAVYAEIDAENQKAAAYAIPNEVDKLYKALGARGINAGTGVEQTVFYADIPKNRLEAWARLEADRFAAPVFRLFQTELESVYEEKNRSLDSAGSILQEALRGALYGEHPYGRTILGSIEHLKNPSLAKMYAFHERFYAPNNMAVAVSGDFDRAALLALLERELGRWSPRALPPRPARGLSPLAAERRVEVRYEAEEQVVLAWRAVDGGHPDADALIVLDMLMDNSEAGLINLRLNQAQKVKRAGSTPLFMNEGGSWQMWAVPKQGQTLEEAEALLLETLAALKAGEFTEEDIAAIVRDFDIRERERLESNAARADAMIEAFVEYRDWPFAAGRLGRLRAVRKADVLRVAEKYLGSARVAALRRKGKPAVPAIEKPEFTKIAIDPGRESAFYRELASLPAAPIEPRWLVEGRDYERRGLPSGALYAAKNPMNDLFQLGLQFERGSRHERKLCEAFSLLELSGADALSAEQLKRKLYALGVRFGLACGEYETGVFLSGPEESFDEALRLMRLRFERPNPAADALPKMVTVRLGEHQDNKLSPGRVLRALAEFARRGKDSAVLAELRDDELKAMTRGELLALIRSVMEYRRRVTYVGTRPAAEVARALAEPGRFYRKPPPRAPLRYPRPARDRLIFVHRDMVQALMGFFAPDEVFRPGELLDYQVYSSYMDGDMSAVIFQEVREARALAYHAEAGYAPGARAGDENALTGLVGTQADKAPAAGTLMLSLLREPPLSAERFVHTRAALEEGLRTKPVPFRAVPGRVLAWRDLGIKKDPRPGQLRALTRYGQADLEKFAARFRGRAMAVFVLGDRARVELEKLKPLGAVEERTLEEIFPY